jgi:hypothetical protein
MIYLALIYVFFQINYDIWGQYLAQSKVIYFAFQYGWVGTIFLLQALKGKDYILYYSLASIMFITSIIYLTKWNLNPEMFVTAVSPKGITAFSVVTVVLLLCLIFSKNITWRKLKTGNG